MVNITLSNLRNSTSFFDMDDMAIIVDGRKKEEIGYFIPKSYKNEFEKFAKEIEKRKKIKLLKRVANAAKKDIIGDEAVDDGIE